MLVECFYFLEDFVSLGRVMDALPEGNVLLRSIGEKFQSVGLCNEGVQAFLKVSWRAILDALMVAKALCI